MFSSPLAAVPVFTVTALLPFLCHLASWRWYGERKESPGPLVRVSDTFAGGPSGGFTFCLAVLVSALAGGVGAAYLRGGFSDLNWVLSTVWAVAAIAGGIGCYRLASAHAPMDGGHPKRLGTGYLVGIAGLPLPILALISSFGGNGIDSGMQVLVQSVVPFVAPLSNDPGPLISNTVLLFLVAVGLNGWADYLRQSKMARAANLASASSLHPAPAALNGTIPVVPNEEENTIPA
jgi:hypothetical protein